MGYARLQEEPFSLDAVQRELTSEGSGGITLYVGTVRAQDAGRRVEALTYEAFGEMAQPTLEALRIETIRRFALVDATVIHRTGRLRAGEPILVVALAGAHRAETYDAVRYFMDRLKETVPIWKREEAATGATWILGESRVPSPSEGKARGL